VPYNLEANEADAPHNFQDSISDVKILQLQSQNNMSKKYVFAASAWDGSINMFMV